MPTNRKRIKRGRQSPFKQAFINYFLHGTNPAKDKNVEGSLECFSIMLNHEKMEALWDENKGGLMREWISKYPGSRLAAWWLYDSPRNCNLMRNTAWENQFPIERKQLSGKGKTSYQRFPSIVPSFFLGVPDSWDEINESDPPVFECQSYLKRFNLLTKEEMQTEFDDKPETVYEILGDE